MTEDERETFEQIVRPLRASGVAPSRSGAGGWYVLRVELLSGLDLTLDPPPGRDMLVSPQHSFRQLAEAINSAFARWDPSHLYAFTMGDGTRIGTQFEDVVEKAASKVKFGGRELGEMFVYEFDFGDSWTHRCTVIRTGVDPGELYGGPSKGPVPVWGWGNIPDQYGRRTPDGDDEEEQM